MYRRRHSRPWTSRRGLSTLPTQAAAIVVVACLTIGCSRGDRPALGRVSGTVTLDGGPLAAALVVFTPSGPGRSSQGRTDAAGRYELDYLRDIAGANLGRHEVRITTLDEAGEGERLPARYHSETELCADVTAGHNTIDFRLDSR